MQQDQRKFKRFELRLPFELLRVGTASKSRVGETQNLSSGGVLFSSESQMEVGEPIEYLITLPSAPEPGTNVRIRCKGKVIRLEHRPDRRSQPFAVAATLERYEFVREQERRAVAAL